MFKSPIKTSTQTRPADGPGRGWFTKAVMSEMLDVNAQHFDRRYRALVPESAVRSTKAGLYFHARTLVDAMIREARAKDAAGQGLSGDDALMTACDGSPALERYRRARAGQEELKLAEMRRDLVRPHALLAAIGPGITVLRGAGSRLELEHGHAAAAIFNEGVDEFEAAVVAALTNAGGVKA